MRIVLVAESLDSNRRFTAIADSVDDAVMRLSTTQWAYDPEGDSPATLDDIAGRLLAGTSLTIHDQDCWQSCDRITLSAA